MNDLPYLVNYSEPLVPATVVRARIASTPSSVPPPLRAAVGTRLAVHCVLQHDQCGPLLLATHVLDGTRGCVAAQSRAAFSLKMNAQKSG